MKYFHPVFYRLIQIDQRLRDNQYPNCNTLASEIEVSPKTVARDIEFMRDFLHAPIEFDKHLKGYYYSEPNFLLPAIQLKESDILSLIVNQRILSQYENTPYYQEIRNVIQKVLNCLPNDTYSDIKADFISFQALPSSAIESHYFELIQQAIQEKKRIKIRYHALWRNEDTERLVDPYLLHNHFANWYLVGFCHLRQKERIFALNRIMAIERTTQEFEIPKNFSIEAMLKHSFNLFCGGETYFVALKFSPFQARWIRERKWHATQKLTELADGHLLLEMEVQGLDNVMRWVLQFGAEVEVVGPEVLRRMVQEEIANMAKIYVE